MKPSALRWAATAVGRSTISQQRARLSSSRLLPTPPVPGGGGGGGDAAIHGSRGTAPTLLAARVAGIDAAAAACRAGGGGVGGVTTGGHSRSMATGTRGSRGHGWYVKYRENRGGRHLQGRYFKERGPEAVAFRRAWNDEIFALNHSDEGAVLRRRRAMGGGEAAAAAGADDAAALPTEAYLEFLTEGWTEPKRVTIELASAVLPKTCTNFIKLCSGGKASAGAGAGADGGSGSDGSSPFDLGYESTIVHKIEKSAGICLGDVHMRGGNGGQCHPSVADLPNGHTFADEGFVISHGGAATDEGGIVSMLSSGVDRNDSRIIITTTGRANQLEGRCVAFGRVKDGMDVVTEISGVFTKRGRPAVEIRVVKCGVVDA